jgi:hypothetical protein
MQTNFFSLISQLDISGILKLVIGKADNGQLIVSILMENNKGSDKETPCLPPLSLRATASELDNGFFDTVSEPLIQTTSFLRSKQQYLKSLESAKSKTQPSQKENANPALSPKEKKYNDLMEQSGKLEAEGKFKEAWTKLPDPLEYPEQAETIRSKRQALSEKFAPDLFAAFDQQNEQKPNEVKNTDPEIDEADLPEEEEDDLEYNEYSGLESDEYPVMES